MPAAALSAEPGILIAEDLRVLVATGAVAGDAPIADPQIQPSSLDLRLIGRRIWRSDSAGSWGGGQGAVSA